MQKTDESIINVEDLTYQYPDKTSALKNVRFSIKAGECIGLIGPNGAGKSTLFLLLMGFLLPQQGKIQILNQQLTKKTRKSLRMKIGMVFQDPNDQLFSPTLWEDVAFGPYNLGYNQEEINRRVDETLERVGLARFKNKAPHYLSFGEKKKAALATILAMDPQILFLDEPFSNLDPESHADILELIKKYKKENLTIILATHDVNMLPELVDRCILLDKGEVIADETAHGILTNYQLLTQHKLQMPLLGQLFLNLKNKNIIPENHLPLTLTEAEDLIEGLLKAQ